MGLLVGDVVVHRREQTLWLIASIDPEGMTVLHGLDGSESEIHLPTYAWSEPIAGGVPIFDRLFKFGWHKPDENWERIREEGLT